MNKENMQKVLDLLIGNEDMFNMSYHGFLSFQEGNLCGTPGCISGFCRPFIIDGKQYSSEFLGLSDTQAVQLFCSATNTLWKKYHKELNLPELPYLLDIKHHHAVTMLTNLISGEWVF